MFKHLIYAVGVMNSSGLYIIKRLIQSAFLFLCRTYNAHAVNRIENFFQMRKNGFVFDIDYELSHTVRL